MDTSPPIACALTPDAYADRVNFILRVNRSALRSYRRRDLALELVYEPGAAHQVRDLVQREQECCAFLRFAVDEAPDEIRLTIHAPPEAGDGIDVLFAPFLEGRTAETAQRLPRSALDVTSSASASEGSGTSPSCHCVSGQMLPVATQPPAQAKRSSRISAIAVTTAGVAVVCGVCCVLPFALPAVVLTVFGGALAAVAHGYPWAVKAGEAVVAAGWLWVGWQSLRTGRRAALSTLRTMAVATLFLAIALSWSFVESHILSALRR